MLKLLIVEDEKWEREGLVDFLQWKDFAVGQVETACDGIDGIRKAETIRPDIIISDIKMPGMDGISMSKKIREFLPDVKIIILTGYDDFRYAKEAISFKANAYVLKPPEEQEMIPVIRKVVEECKAEREKSERENLIREQLNENLGFARVKFLSDLLAGNIETQQIGEQIARFGIQVPLDGIYTVVSAKIPVEVRNGFNDTYFVLDIFEKILEAALVFSLPDPNECQVCFCHCSKAGGASLLDSKVSEAYDAIYNEKGYHIIVGIGKSVEQFENISESYSSASQAIDFGIFWSSHNILIYNEISELRYNFACNSSEFLIRSSFFTKQLVHAVKSSDGDRVSELLNEMFRDIGENRGASRDFIINYLQNIINETSIFLYTLDRINQEAAGNSAGREGMLSDLPTLESVEVRITAFFQNTLEILTDKKSNKDEQIIKKVVRLIEERYMSDISLKIISGEVYLSPNYLGNIFKKCTGRTFNEYLCEYRMEKAKELLNSPKNKVSWVASKVGIPNTSYFCTIFRNTYGLAPGEYQEMSFMNQ